MLPKPIREAAKLIGEFYLQKNNGDYNKTEQEIINLRISKLEIIGNKLHITTELPGWLIGKRGENIYKIETLFKEKMQLGISVSEDQDCLQSCLVPIKEDESYFECQEPPKVDEMFDVWKRLKNGEKVTTNDQTLDMLSAYFDQQDTEDATMFFNYLSSSPNIHQVGTRDQYICWLKTKEEISKDMERS